jgi:valyl-tRNA synthetase
MLDVYPTVKNDKDFLSFGNEAAALEIDVTKDVVSAIRNIRGENRISPAEKIIARLSCNDEIAQKILGNNRDSIVTLGRLSDLQIGEPGSLSKCAVAPVEVKGMQIQVIIPLEGLVDLDEEIKRIQKQVEKLGKEITSISGRLANPNFLANAAEDIVTADRESLSRSETQVKMLQEALFRLSAK